jgi:hypothetical protein
MMAAGTPATKLARSINAGGRFRSLIFPELASLSNSLAEDGMIAVIEMQ